jgi:drug/metabolite transporter (DMT)-like permease
MNKILLAKILAAFSSLSAGSAIVGISLTLAPISAFIFAWPVLGEVISYQSIVGLILVVSAIVIMNRQT